MNTPDLGPDSSGTRPPTLYTRAAEATLLTPSGGVAGPGRPPAPSHGTAPGAAGDLFNEIRAQLERYHALDHQAGIHPQEITELDRLLHLKNLLRNIARAHAAHGPYRLSLVAVAAQAIRWIQWLDQQEADKAAERPVNPPRRPPRTDLVRRFFRRPPAPTRSL